MQRRLFRDVILEWSNLCFGLLLSLRGYDTQGGAWERIAVRDMGIWMANGLLDSTLLETCHFYSFFQTRFSVFFFLHAPTCFPNLHYEIDFSFFFFSLSWLASQHISSPLLFSQLLILSCPILLLQWGLVVFSRRLLYRYTDLYGIMVWIEWLAI